MEIVGAPERHNITQRFNASKIGAELKGNKYCNNYISFSK